MSNPAEEETVDVGAVVGVVVMIAVVAAFAVGLFFLGRNRRRVMDYHTDVDDSFELDYRHKMSHGNGGGGSL